MEDTSAPKYGLTALLFVTTTVYHGMGVLFMILVLMSCIDYITGIISGAVQGKLSSRISLYGVFRKVGLIVLVPVAILIDFVLQNSGYTKTTILYHAVTSWLIATEAISIIENVAKMGAPVPPLLKQVLLIFGSLHHGHEEVKPTKRRKS